MVKFPEMNNVAFLNVLHTVDMLIAALQLVFYANKKDTSERKPNILQKKGQKSKLVNIF